MPGLKFTKGGNFVKMHYNNVELKPLVRMFQNALTLSQTSTTKVPYANSLDLDETLSNSASHPDPSCLTIRQYFQIEADEK